MHGISLTHAIGKHFQKNFWLYIVSLLCLCTGLVLGVYTVKYMGEVEKSDLLSYFSSFTVSVKSMQVNHTGILFETIKNNIPLIAAIWILGLTMVGIPIILIIDIIKGFTLGFTVAFIINGMGLKGVWFAIISVFPQNIIYIPCILIASVLAMEFSLVKLREKFNKQIIPTTAIRSSGYTVTVVIVALVMFLGFMLEAYFTPNIIRTVAIGIGSVII